MEVVPDKMDVKHMDATFRSVFMDVSPCVVIVEQIGRIDKFCVGSVISSEKDEGTFILTQAEITSPSANLAVRFFDGIKLPVTPLLTIGKMCILMTTFHSKYKAIEFLEGGHIEHNYGVIIAPATKSSMYNIPGFIIQKSLEAGCYNSESLIPGTETRFTFSCLYGDQSSNGVSRVLYGPVFDMHGKVVGFVIDDMEYAYCPSRADKDYIAYHGTELKVVESSSIVQADLSTALGGDDGENCLLTQHKILNKSND